MSAFCTAAIIETRVRNFELDWTVNLLKWPFVAKIRRLTWLTPSLVERISTELTKPYEDVSNNMERL